MIRVGEGRLSKIYCHLGLFMGLLNPQTGFVVEIVRHAKYKINKPTNYLSMCLKFKPKLNVFSTLSWNTQLDLAKTLHFCTLSTTLAIQATQSVIFVGCCCSDSGKTGRLEIYQLPLHVTAWFYIMYQFLCSRSWTLFHSELITCHPPTPLSKIRIGNSILWNKYNITYSSLQGYQHLSRVN